MDGRHLFEPVLAKADGRVVPPPKLPKDLWRFPLYTGSRFGGKKIDSERKKIPEARTVGDIVTDPKTYNKAGMDKTGCDLAFKNSKSSSGVLAVVSSAILS